MKYLIFVDTVAKNSCSHCADKTLELTWAEIMEILLVYKDWLWTLFDARISIADSLNKSRTRRNRESTKKMYFTCSDKLPSSSSCDSIQESTDSLCMWSIRVGCLWQGHRRASWPPRDGAAHSTVWLVQPTPSPLPVNHTGGVGEEEALAVSPRGPLMMTGASSEPH